MIYSTPLIRVLVFLLAIPFRAHAADFAGSQACAECHAEIYRNFMQTPMARSSGRAGSNEVKERLDRAEFRDSQGAFTYRIGQDSGKYYFDFAQQRANPGGAPLIQGRRQLDYFVGSGSAARTYLMSVDGFLYEAPVTYYNNSASWQPAPGYSSRSTPYLTRPILPGCLECHSSFVQRIPGMQNAYASPPFKEGGVACERCHGAGSDHIARGTPMIDPAKLPSAQRESICEQCHLSGEIRVPKPGKDDLSFKAGDRIDDVFAVFVQAGSSSQVRVTSHAENLAASACKRASGEKMWCGSCHDPHTAPSATEKAAYFRAKCLNCHAPSDCRGTQALRDANKDDCISCHMPRNTPSDVEHVVFTDHSIPRRPPSNPAASSPRADADLLLFRGGEASKRDLGLAYAIAGLRDGNDTYVDRAFSLLKDVAASKGTAADPLPLAYLAQFYRDRKDDKHALPLYTEAWQQDRTQPAVAAAIGAYWMELGNTDQAIAFWNRALAMSPSMVLVRLNLAQALLRTGRGEEAKAILRKALEFDPAFQDARDLLNRIAP